MDARAPTRLVVVRFYVRPSRTLVTQVVSAGVGGRSRPLHQRGGRMDLGASDLAEVDPEVLAGVLMRAALRPDAVTTMSRDQQVSWQRSWTPGGPQ
jgi:hypothetical protein